MLVKKHDKEINDYLEFANTVENDTVLTQWGMLTHDDRYKGRTGDIVSKIQSDTNLTTEQAYYFLYTILQSGMTYEEAKAEILSSKEFEENISFKKGRK